jgi:hypothetical protein
MSKSKTTQQVNAKLASVFAEVQPANPAPSSTDKAYLRGLKKRGFTDAEIIQVAAKAGFKITADMLVVKPKKLAVQSK